MRSTAATAFIKPRLTGFKCSICLISIFNLICKLILNTLTLPLFVFASPIPGPLRRLLGYLAQNPEINGRQREDTGYAYFFRVAHLSYTPYFHTGREFSYLNLDKLNRRIPSQPSCAANECDDTEGMCHTLLPQPDSVVNLTQQHRWQDISSTTRPTSIVNRASLVVQEPSIRFIPAS